MSVKTLVVGVFVLGLVGFGSSPSLAQKGAPPAKGPASSSGATSSGGTAPSKGSGAPSTDPGASSGPRAGGGKGPQAAGGGRKPWDGKPGTYPTPGKGRRVIMDMPLGGRPLPPAKTDEQHHKDEMRRLEGKRDVLKPGRRSARRSGDRKLFEKYDLEIRGLYIHWKWHQRRLKRIEAEKAKKAAAAREAALRAAQSAARNANRRGARPHKNRHSQPGVQVPYRMHEMGAG